MDRFDIGRAIKAPFEDAEWIVKTLLALLWSVLVVTAPAVTGAQLEYIRRVSRGNEEIPTWDDFGTKWVQGLLVFIAGFLYALPLIIIGAVVLVPVIVVSSNGGDSGAGVSAAIVGGCLFSVVAIVYAAALSVFFSAAMTHYAMTESFGAFFEFRTVVGKVRAGTGYFAAWLWVIVISMVASSITGLISGITGGFGSIVLPAFSYLSMLMMGHVLGQWARAAYAGAGWAPPAAQVPAPPAGQIPAPPAGPVTPPPPPPPYGG